MKNRIFIVIVVVSMIHLAACINIYNPPATPPTPTTPLTPTIPIKPILPVVPLVQFEDRTWVLEQYGKAGSLQDAISGKEVNARFDSSSGKVSGSAGCNSFSAAYQRTMNKVTVNDMVSTKVFCITPAGIMQQESDFTNALSGAESCKITNNKLEINCTLDRLLIFKPK